jgi:esterase/lipase superfamily enzyme
MAIRDGRVAPKIRNVILASPDIDVDVFGHQFRDLGDRHPKFTVFVSRDDRALAVSRFVAGNVNRLGQIDPEAEPYRSEAAKDGIAFIDLTRLKAPGADLNHDKFAASPEIVRAIGTRLVNGQSLSESQIGLGDSITILAAGTAKAVGTGAGLLVSTPLAVVDPATRRNLGSQADDFAEQLGTATRLGGGYRTSAEIDPAKPALDSR